MNAPDLAGLRVVFIAGTLGMGGAERQLYYAVRAAESLGMRPTVLTLTAGEYWQARLEEAGVEVRMVGASGSRAVRVMTIVRELRALRPHIVQSQHLYVNLYAVPAARIVRAAEIGAMRSDGVFDVASVGRVLGRIALRAPKVLAVNSEQGISRAVDLGVPRRRMVYLPNVVDAERYSPASTRGEEGAVVLGVGRLSGEKRFDRFLRVVAEVRSSALPDIRARIVGDGPDRAALERYAVSLGLGPEVVEFRGTQDDMAGEYAGARALLLTSDHEGTPNVVLEAMSSGLPVVGTAVGGVPDLAAGGMRAVVVPADDEHTLAVRLAEALRGGHEVSEMTKRARDWIVEERSAEALAGHLRSLYVKALG